MSWLIYSKYSTNPHNPRARRPLLQNEAARRLGSGGIEVNEHVLFDVIPECPGTSMSSRETAKGM